MPSNYISTIAVEVNPAGQNIRPNVPAKSHDYCHIFAVDANQSKMLLRNLTDEEKAQYKEKDKKGRFLWDNLRRRGGNSRPSDRPNQWYPLYVDLESKTVSLEPFSGGTEVWPIDPKGERRIWRVSPEGAEKGINNGDISVIEKAGRVEVVKKSRMPKGKKPKTLWKDSLYSATTYGTKLLSDIVSVKGFTYPKSLYLVKDCIDYWAEQDDIVLDFFAGSGTTGHAILNLNQQDDGDRRFILVEVGDYFDSVLVPRLKKVSFSGNWKNGKPVGKKGESSSLSTGQSNMFQYIRLESYDDTFHNISFQNEDAAQISFLAEIPDYFMTYMLEHETAGSPTLLDIKQFDRPFDYKLLVTDTGGVLSPRPVDLVTTFNFLLGLAVETVREFQRKDVSYVRVAGVNPEGRHICILWRNVPPVEEMDDEKNWLEQEVLSGIEIDKLYINGDSSLPNALSTEEEFKRRMFEGVR